MTTTLTVSELAALKKCSRSTIYNNSDAFTWIKVPGTKSEKIVWDHKAQDWEQQKSMTRVSKKRRQRS